MNRNNGRFEVKIRSAEHIIFNVKNNLNAILAGHPLLLKRCFDDVLILCHLHVDVPTIHGGTWAPIRWNHPF